MKSARVDAAFAALADPTRRDVIRALVQQPRRAGELAAKLRISAPALSRHLRVLRSAGLIVDEAIEDDARVRVYRMTDNALAPARAWLDDVERFWSLQLQAFKAHAEQPRRGRPRRPRKTS
jgi:DNA-binding transcriptional ArsR family regulator